MQNERLREALLRKGFTPAKLAEHIGVDPKTAERWIGQGRIPYPRNRYEIAALVGETEGYLWPTAVAPKMACDVAQSEVVSIYPRRSAVPFELWTRLLNESTDNVGVLAFAGLFLPEQIPALVGTLEAKGKAGATVELLLGDPDSPAVALRGPKKRLAMPWPQRSITCWPSTTSCPIRRAYRFVYIELLYTTQSTALTTRC